MSKQTDIQQVIEKINKLNYYSEFGPEREEIIALLATVQAEQRKLIEKLARLVNYADCAKAGSKHDFKKCQWCLDREAVLAAVDAKKEKNERT